MTNTVFKYSVTFLIGALFSYLILSQENLSNIEGDTNASASQIKPTIDVKTASQIIKNYDIEQPQAKQNQVLKSDEEIIYFTNNIDGEISDLIPVTHQQLLTKLAETQTENAMLKHRLEQLEPSNVSDEQIKAIIPEEYASIVSSFSGKIKEQIVDLHQQEDDLDWGLRKQQELLYFINTHQNGHQILITSLICKIDQCQLILDEKTTRASLKEEGFNFEEVEHIVSTQQPKYKKIFDDLRLQPELNLYSSTYTPNRFGIYALLKDKSQLTNNYNLL